MRVTNITLGSLHLGIDRYLEEPTGHEFVTVDDALTATPFIRVLTEACIREPCKVKRVRRVFRAPGGRPVVCAQGHDVQFVYPIADEALFGAPEECAADVGLG